MRTALVYITSTLQALTGREHQECHRMYTRTLLRLGKLIHPLNLMVLKGVQHAR